MKPLCIIIVLATVCPASGQNHWIMLDRPTSRNLNKVCFIDTALGWVAGESGTILKTTNGGLSWLSQSSGISNEILNLFMWNQSFGWALALQYPQDTLWYGTIILKTTNGGVTWTRRDYPQDFFYAIAFHDSVNGWVGGDQGKIRGTTDGGLTWSPAPVDSSLFSTFPILNFNFFSRNYGYALGGHLDLAGVVWRTTDGGRRWAATGVSGMPVRALHYIDSLHHLAIGGDFNAGSGMVRSKDAGRTW